MTDREFWESLTVGPSKRTGDPGLRARLADAGVFNIDDAKKADLVELALRHLAPTEEAETADSSGPSIAEQPDPPVAPPPSGVWVPDWAAKSTRLPAGVGPGACLVRQRSMPRSLPPCGGTWVEVTEAPAWWPR